MVSDIAPFRIAENLYFVGTQKASSHLLVTSEGLVLFEAEIKKLLHSSEAASFIVSD